MGFASSARAGPGLGGGRGVGDFGGGDLVT